MSGQPSDTPAGIADRQALQAHVGPVSPLAEKKLLTRLDGHCRRFISLSPFLVLSTADAQGRPDASPRGDPPGFVRVLDDTTLLLPDRPGNNLVDSFGNLLERPGVGLLFMVPGMEETLRVNGTARLTTDATLLAGSALHGKAPKTGLLIEVREVFFHCAKALKRSRLWDPAAQIDRATFPSFGRIIADQQNGLDADDVEARLQVAYRDRLY